MESVEKVTLSENPGDGLNGYIDTWYNTDPKYQYGTSFYTTVWPILKSPLANYQVGLPSTWFIPNNDTFKKPLCPQGTVARNWPDRGPTWNTVFQTMEGGLGNWVWMQFPSAMPKYRMGGTPDCYSTTVTSIGWGSIGGQNAMPPEKMGIAQLSNSIIHPPDGITFQTNSKGQLGQAYMPIPLLPKQTQPQPTGDHSWTLFLNAQNFSGPVGFYIPNFWSRLSQTYPTISGRGLDSLPAIMDTTAMEVNTVPYFSAKDTNGNTYSKIPALNFPVDSSGHTILSQGVNFYTANAFYTPVKTAFATGKTVPNKFLTGTNLTMSPQCSLDPLSFTQGPNKTPITGLDSIVKTYSVQENGQCTFGLQWANAKGTGTFPEYFKQQGTNLIPVKAGGVPNNTKLKNKTFTPATIGEGYFTPTPLDSTPYWNKYVANQPSVTVQLADGSELEYRWYRFVDQPAIAALNLTVAEQNRLQASVEQIHKSWQNQQDFMPPPPVGELVAIDPGVLVKPPSGLEYGYVPIPIRQTPANKTQTFMFDAKNATKFPKAEEQLNGQQGFAEKGDLTLPRHLVRVCN